jgi:hypothetical protein
MFTGNPGLGMQLTLSDFDSKDSPPSWLPRDKWEDILALSVLPGPLDSLCVSFASASTAWHQWYRHPYPEQVALPLAESEAIKAQEDSGRLKNMCDRVALHCLGRELLPLRLYIKESFLGIASALFGFCRLAMHG